MINKAPDKNKYNNNRIQGSEMIISATKINTIITRTIAHDDAWSASENAYLSFAWDLIEFDKWSIVVFGEDVDDMMMILTFH